MLQEQSLIAEKYCMFEKISGVFFCKQIKHFDIYYLFFTQYMHTFEFKYCTLINISVNSVCNGNHYTLVWKQNTVINKCIAASG